MPAERRLDVQFRYHAHGTRHTAHGTRHTAHGIALERLTLFVLLFGTASLGGAQSLTIAFTASDFNGYNISCFGYQNGAIDAAVTGGTAPYTFAWSTGAVTEDLAGLSSGYYHLTVTDANSATADADITLVEPMELKVIAEAFKYPRGMNISCHECFNGSIDLEVENGVPPYAYDWHDNVYTQDRSGLGALNYAVMVTDNNGCQTKSETIPLKQPDSDDWKMGGNANTDPATQFIGTTDAQDVVFKSNGQEMVRLKSNGDIMLNGSLGAAGLLYRRPDGTVGSGPVFPIGLGLPCLGLGSWPFWQTEGNNFDGLCPGLDPLLGTLNNRPLKIITNGLERMTITTTGKVGIGTEPPVSTSPYRLFVEGGIATRDVLVKLDEWPDYVFDDGYRLMPMSELRAFLQHHKHLPGIPSASDLEAQGGLALGDMQRGIVRTVEEQALYILELEERLERLERRLQNLETTR